VRTTVITVTVGILVSVALGFITGIPGLGVVGGISAAAVPWALTRTRAARRSRLIAEEWPGVIDELISALRSGGTVTAAMSLLAESSRGVISAGARDFMIAVSTTSDVSGSLSLAKRVWASAVGDRVAETLRLAGECGGAGVMLGLVALARDVRRESSVQAEVRARAAWIRVAAVVGALIALQQPPAEDAEATDLTLDPADSVDPVSSADATAVEANSPPTPNATARAPTRPTYRAWLDAPRRTVDSMLAERCAFTGHHLL
jgi:hypothetical protein